MKKVIAIAITALTIIACSTKETNLQVNAEIDGLKKGTVYLQKLEDTSMVNLDSVMVNGEKQITLSTFIEEPQVLYLFLDKGDNKERENRLDFFAEKGEMNIKTSLKNYGKDMVVEGSENQKKLEEYRNTMKRFNDQRLDLIQESFEAEKSGNDSLITAAGNKYNSFIKRKYLYTINYAVNNKDSEIAPYLAISEVYDANIKLLDTVYKSLTSQIKDSKYGKELQGFIAERKEQENQQASIE